jgi:hypothetical protein
MKTTEKNYDAITGEETVIEREMSAKEIADYQNLLDFIANEKIKNDKIEADKAALLAKLGITADEAKLLLS